MQLLKNGAMEAAVRNNKNTSGKGIRWAVAKKIKRGRTLDKLNEVDSSEEEDAGTSQVSKVIHVMIFWEGLWSIEILRFIW